MFLTTFQKTASSWKKLAAACGANNKNAVKITINITVINVHSSKNFMDYFLTIKN